MKKLRLRQFFSWGSIFTRTFYGMLALSVCVILIFYLVLNSTLAQHQREQIATYHLNTLRLSAASMETTLDALSQGMSQIMWNPDFVGYMVTPNQSSQELHYRICQQMKSIVSSSNLLERAYFYSPFSDTVFQNSNILLSRETMPDREILQAFEAVQHKKASNLSKTSTNLFHYQGRLFLFQELNIATHIGTLVYELNLDEIYHKLLSSDESDSMLVLDREGNPIFPTEQVIPSNWKNSGNLITYADLDTQRVWDTEGYYYYEGADGWSFLLPLNAGTLTIPLRQLLLTYLPIFLLLIVVGIAFALYISQVIYRPIDHLMQVVSPNAVTGDSVEGNEVDILEMVYSSAQKEYKQLQGVISSIAPEILESMLKNLLIGKHLTQERVSEILHGVGDPISVKGRFFVLACQIVPDKRDIEDTEINLYLLAIRKLVQRLSVEECHIYDIRSDVLTLGLICCFPEDRTLTQLSQDCRQIQQTLRFHTEAMPFQFICARGKFYSNLLDVRYSYREALENLQYQQYLRSTGETNEEELIEEDSEPVMDQRLIKSRCEDIMEQVERGVAGSAESLLDRVLEEIDHQSPDEVQFRRLVQMLLDEMMDRVIAYPLTKEDQQLLLQRRLVPDGQEPELRKDIRRSAQEKARLIFHMVAVYSQKSRYKYIEQAKQYVADNYMDSSLSLNSVGDYVNISASYLSELWSEVTNEKFSAYLAKLRIEKAQQLLSTTKLPIKEIGFRCGFNSAQNFIRVFKKYSGIPPGQFRSNL